MTMLTWQPESHWLGSRPGLPSRHGQAERLCPCGCGVALLRRQQTACSLSVDSETLIAQIKTLRAAAAGPAITKDIRLTVPVPIQ